MKRKAGELDEQVDADRCFCSLSTSPCRCRFPLSLLLLPFRFPCTRCPVFVNTRPVNSKASKLRAVCHTTRHEIHFVSVLVSPVVQTFLFMHFSYLGQTSLSLSLYFSRASYSPMADSRYETDKRCFPLPLSLLPLPKLFTSAYVTGVRTMTKVRLSKRSRSMSSRSRPVSALFEWTCSPIQFFSFAEKVLK